MEKKPNVSSLDVFLDAFLNFIWIAAANFWGK